MSTHTERKRKIDEQLSEIMKLGLERWLLTNRNDDDTMWWKTIHSDVKVYYALYDKPANADEILNYSCIDYSKNDLDAHIERSKKYGKISDNLYNKWKEIRSEERKKEEENEVKRKKLFEDNINEKERAIDKILETITYKLLLMHSSINC